MDRLTGSNGTIAHFNPTREPQNNWRLETPHTTTVDKTFIRRTGRDWYTGTLPWTTLHSDGEPRWIYMLPSPTAPSSPRKMKWKLEMGMSLPERRGVSQHLSEACGRMIPPTKCIPRQSTRNWNSTNTHTLHIHAIELTILFNILYLIWTIRTAYVSFHKIYFM